MNVRPRLTLSGRGLGASVTIGPLRITRSGRGRFSFGLALPRARARRAADPVRARDPRPGPRLLTTAPCGCRVMSDQTIRTCRWHTPPRPGAWPAPEGPRLTGPREGA